MFNILNLRLFIATMIFAFVFIMAGLQGAGKKTERIGSLENSLLSGANPAGRKSSLRIRALVDASKNRVYWAVALYNRWQYEAHSTPGGFIMPGKAIVDAIRKRGWESAELSLTDVITSDKLRNFNIIVRPSPCIPYSESEAKAYQEAVASGARLLLMGSPGGDAIARGFGLSFGKSRQRSLTKIVQNKLTEDMVRLEIPWIDITEMPHDAVPLAWEAGGKPLIGYYRYGEGYILFAGVTMSVESRGTILYKKLLDFLERYSFFDLNEQTGPAPVQAAEASARLPFPALTSPENGDQLPQPFDAPWNFVWACIPGARKYQIIVQVWGAGDPEINTKTESCEFTMPRRRSYPVSPNQPWIWRVRAQDKSGNWGSWSEKRLFYVLPYIEHDRSKK
jgi:hypothetical protein